MDVKPLQVIYDDVQNRILKYKRAIIILRQVRILMVINKIL